MSLKSLKFLQLSDLHLGKSFMEGKLKLPWEKAEKRTREQRDAFIRALEMAREEKVDLILIAGDLWEEEGLNADSVSFVFEVLSSVDLPVVIAPGNHDYFAPSSHYANEIARLVTGRDWPENVTVVRDYEFTHTQLPGLEGVCITGLAYHSNQPVQIRKLNEKLNPPEADIHICLFHGSRDDHLPQEKLRTMPFSDAELLAQPFDYTALGHYHTESFIKDESGMIRAAYSGSAFTLSADETGEHGCLIGHIRPGGIDKSDLLLHELDPRRIHRLDLNISGLLHVQAVEAKILETLTNAGVRNQDMALMKLEGVCPYGIRLNFAQEFLNESCFHLRIDTTAVQPEWVLEEEKQTGMLTTESVFRSRMKKMIDDAAAHNDIDEETRLRNALFYGLDALHGRQIMPRQIN